MQKQKKRGLYESGKIIYLPTEKLFCAPTLRRRAENQAPDAELSRSVARYGILQPLSVCRIGERYKIISGSRRWDAAKRAGITEVPCILLDVGEPETEVYTLLENLQNREFDFIEEAEYLHRLIDLHGFGRAAVSRRLGISQSAIANKLRILRLSPKILSDIRTADLTERHARALLRLENEKQQRDALAHIIEHGLNVTQTDELVDSLVSRHSSVYLINDLRMFINTVTRGVMMLKNSGLKAELSTDEREDGLLMTVTVTYPTAAFKQQDPTPSPKVPSPHI